MIRQVRIIAGVLLLFLFIFPYGEIDSLKKDLKYVYSVKEWLLSIFICCSIAWLGAFFYPKEISFKNRQKTSLPFILIPAAVLLSTFLGYYSFSFRPHLVDSIIQIWQAKIFSLGELYSSYPDGLSFFVSQHMLFDQGRMYSQYPPGNALFLTLNLLTDIPFLSAIIFSGLTLICGYRFTVRIYGRQAGNCFLFLSLFNAFFLFNSQSYMNHVPGLAFMAVFLDYYSAWKQHPKHIYLILSGISLGLVFLCRPLEGALIFCLITILNLTNVRSGIIFLLGFTPVAGFYFLYNFHTTGDPFMPGYLKLWGKAHDLGFHMSPWGVPHTFSQGLEGFYINLKLLNEYLFESPVPPLSILGVFFLLDRQKFTEWDRFLIFGSLAIPVVYIFYWHRDSFLGPRYTYLALAFFMPFFSHAVTSLMVILGGRYFPQGNTSLRKVSLKTLFIFVLLISALFSAAIGIPIRAEVYATSFSSMKKNLLEDLPREALEEAIVFVKVSFGTRIIVSLRELGISASLTEISYRSIDHCELGSAIKEFRNSKAELGRLVSWLEGRIAEKAPLIKSPINGDPSFRIKSKESMTAECKDEIEYDLTGYTLYEPHLLLNTPDFPPPFVVARDMRNDNNRLMELYPQINKHFLWWPNNLRELEVR